MTSPKTRVIRFTLLGYLLSCSVSTVVMADETEEQLSEQKAELPTVEELTNFLDDLYRADSSYGKLEMMIITEYWERTLEIEEWSKGKDLALFKIRKPAKERGIATLKRGKELWNYLPDTGEEMKIPSSLLSDSWFGSHFTNDDLVRESSYEEDYDASVETGSQEGTLVLVLIPKPDSPVVYSKVNFVLRATDWQPIRAEYLDEDGELVRTMTFKNHQEMGGRVIPTVMELVPTDKPDELTRVTYLEMEFNIEISDDKFTLRALKR